MAAFDPILCRTNDTWQLAAIPGRRRPSGAGNPRSYVRRGGEMIVFSRNRNTLLTWSDDDVAMEQRKQVRREASALISMRIAAKTVTGRIRDISFDGALVGIEDGNQFDNGDIGAKLAIDAIDGALPELRSEAKLVRIFDDDATQYVAIRFLDYMGTAG
jgi:hypothetical protein